jgi:hypothetical protein
MNSWENYTISLYKAEITNDVVATAREALSATELCAKGPNLPCNTGPQGVGGRSTSSAETE